MKFVDQVIVLNTLLNIKSSYKEITPEIHKWADTECFAHKGYYYKTKKMVHGTITCMDCLKEFSAFNAGIKTHQNGTATVVCPHCGKILTIEQTRKKTDQQYSTFKIDQMIDGVKVTRVFEATRSRNINQRNEKTGVICDAFNHYSWFEVVRKWDNGKSVEYCARNIGMFEYCRTSPWGTDDITHNRKSDAYSKKQCYTDDYLNTDHICEYQMPDLKLNAKFILDIVSTMSNELKSKAKKEQITRLVLRYPMFETMVKAGYLKLACAIANRGNSDFGNHFMYGYGYYSNHYDRQATLANVLTAAKICIRNKYQIEDHMMYLDYMNDLENLKLDFHNAHYVCPPDLKAAHALTIGQIQSKIRKQQEKENEERNERKVIEAKEHDTEYQKNKHEYLGIAFEEPTQGLKFSVIQSASAMQEEGNRMHHCVGGYWSYAWSLIISCRKADNSRLATIEVNLDSFKISQTRGVHNSQPEHKTLIEDTIMQHMNEIKEAKKRQKQFEKDLAKAEAMLLKQIDKNKKQEEQATPCIHALMAM